MDWNPHITVAAVIEREGRFLLVEEETPEGLAFNQPAGHWEKGESLMDAVIRETREETAFDFFPEYLVGIYSWHHPLRDVTFLRFAFGGSVGAHYPDQVLDDGILAARWLRLSEINDVSRRHRSPLVLHCIEDYLAGKRYSLDILRAF